MAEHHVNREQTPKPIHPRQALHGHNLDGNFAQGKKAVAFLKKSSAKNVHLCQSRACRAPQVQINKSLFAAFSSKKTALAFLFPHQRPCELAGVELA
jgi:hypothetical protein